MTHQVAHDKWTQPDPHTAARWITDQERMDRGLAPFGARLLELAALLPGEHVLDIGCGTGATTLAAWVHVAPAGSVTGVDISPSMLEAARARALHDVPDARIAWLQADAETFPFSRSAADVAISRFGLAHFGDTASAFRNLHSALRRGGRFVFVEWTARAENEWMSLADDVARRVLPELFSEHQRAAEHSAEFADQQRLRALLEEADFDVLSVQKVEDGLWVGSTPADVLAWFARLREGRILETLDAGARQAYLSELERELQQRTRPDGVHLAGTAWIVDARAQLG